jgi:hypothetical protein
LDYVDLLSNASLKDAKADDFIAVTDHDNNDLIVIHTKRMLTEEKLRQENRQLLKMNRRLELQRDVCQTNLDLLKAKTKEHMSKMSNDVQVRKTTL